MYRFAPTAVLLALSSAVPLLAQTQEELIERHEKKLAEDWLQLAPWTTDYATALERAKETGKPIFAYFSRSYAP